jgi:hypothetical protein
MQSYYTYIQPHKRIGGMVPAQMANPDQPDREPVGNYDRVGDRRKINMGSI